MKTRTFVIGAAIAAVLGSATANAQLLGGGASGGLGGALSGGMHGVEMTTRGAASGSFGGELDAGSLRGTASRAANHVGRRGSDSIDTLRDRSRSKLSEVRGAAKSVTTQVDGNANDAVQSAGRIQSSAASSSALASSATAADARLATANDATLVNESQGPATATPAGRIGGEGALDTGVQPGASLSEVPLGSSAQAEGAASGGAAISKSNVTASAQGEGSAHVSRQ